MATRVSISGGWMSAISPHWNRLRSRSSNPSISVGSLSEVKKICLPA